MFGRHLKKEYRRSMHRIYELDSGEPIGERYGSVSDPYLQIAARSMAVSFVVIILIDKILPYLNQMGRRIDRSENFIYHQR